MTDTGGPAFPTKKFPTGYESEPYRPREGMTLLDYFAGQALAGCLAWSPGGARGFQQINPNDAAELSYGYAAEMVAEKRRLEQKQRREAQE